MNFDHLDHYQRSSRNFFAANPIDRLVDKRRNAAWLAEQISAPDTRFVPIWRTQTFFEAESSALPRFLTATELPEHLNAENMTLLGELNGTVYFALDVETTEGGEAPLWLKNLGAFRDLRAVGLALEPTQGAILAYARAMIYWQRRHRFCGDCGSPTQSTEGGFVRTCTNSSCGKQIFPRTDPAIIVLVRSGDRCLLARQPSWPAGRYSVIAGFVEPGESLEDAVKREVMEEAGIIVGAIHYHSSQPWPFPSSLMLGFIADAITTTFEFIDDELEEARWLTREDIATEVKAGTLKLPPGLSISHRLIESWFDVGEAGKLNEIVSDQW